MIGTLKAAFVHGMLAKDEFDQRVGQTLAARTHADLAAVTADLPAGLAAAQPPQPARAEGGQPVLRPGKVIAVATALYAGVWPFTFLLPWPTMRAIPRGNNHAVLLDHPHLPVRFGHSCGVCDRRVGGRSVPAGSGRGGQRLARAVSHPGACHRQARAGSFLRPIPVTGTPPKQPEAVVPVGGGCTSRRR